MTYNLVLGASSQKQAPKCVAMESQKREMENHAEMNIGRMREKRRWAIILEERGIWRVGCPPQRHMLISQRAISHFLLGEGRVDVGVGGEMRGCCHFQRPHLSFSLWCHSVSTATYASTYLSLFSVKYLLLLNYHILFGHTTNNLT